MRHREFGILVCDQHSPLPNADIYISFRRLNSPDRAGDPSNEVFRAYRYAVDSPQIRNRVRGTP